MFDAKSVSRALLLTTVVAVAAAPAASAREADAPVHQSPAVVVTAPVAGTPASVPPRVDGIGQQPSDPGRVASSPASVPPRVDGIGQPPTDRGGRVAVPSVQAKSDDGFDWTLAAIGAAALLSLALLAGAGATMRSRRLAHR